MPIKSKIHRTFVRNARRFLRSRRGNIAALTALLIVPLVGLMGIATEGGSWFLIQRAAQNAADSAAIAAATNGGNGGTNFVTEAKSVTAKYGFTDGASDTTVTVPNPLTTYSSVSSCVSTPCYRVTVSHNVPLYLLQVVGYTGDATANGGPGQSITATALATTKVINAPFCLTAKGTEPKKGYSISANGIPKPNIDCNIAATGDASCVPGADHPLTTGYSDVVGTAANTCSTKTHSVGSVSDPYAALASNIPANPCKASDYSWVPTKHSDPALLAKNQWSLNSLPTGVVCGDYQLQNDITISGGGTLVIENGSLDLNGHTLTGTGLTIILSGTGSAAHANEIISNQPHGTLTITAPTSGTWSGIAVYQDPVVAQQSLTYAGITPVWNVTGVMYLPKTDLTANGAIGKPTGGYACITLVVNSISVGGTGDLFYQNPQSQCTLAGVTSPTNAAYVIGQLVY